MSEKSFALASVSVAIVCGVFFYPPPPKQAAAAASHARTQGADQDAAQMPTFSVNGSTPKNDCTLGERNSSSRCALAQN